MGVFNRDTAVPHEPSAAERIPAAIDRQAVLAILDRLAGHASRQGNRALVDRILDERALVQPPLPLRPAVPVIPGRPM